MLSIHYGRLPVPALMMVVLFLIAGCALPVREWSILYIPQENVQPVKDAAFIPVEVRVEDLQTAPFASPWSPSYLFSQPAQHYRVKDAAGTIKSAAETELGARGFEIGSGGALVTIQLAHLEATLKTDPWGPTTVRAYLWMRVQVRPQTGKIQYSRDVGGEASQISDAILWHPATRELQGSLADAFRRLFADPAFTAAILATRQQPPAKPVVSPAHISGAFAIASRR
jgi:hypothetical protein